jgi:hypothetical protein
MTLKLTLIAGSAIALAACGTTTTERALTGGAIGAGAGALVGSGSGEAGTGALLGGAIGAGVGAATTPSDRVRNRREYYDARTGRYYFRDPATGRFFYEDGAPYP